MSSVKEELNLLRGRLDELESLTYNLPVVVSKLANLEEDKVKAQEKISPSTILEEIISQRYRVEDIYYNVDKVFKVLDYQLNGDTKGKKIND